MPFTHYIIVRRDMPTGAATAQVVHAAGESFYYFAFYNCGLWPDVRRTIAVVLGVKGEKELRQVARRLTRNNIPHHAIIENEGPLAGQMTAIGCFPVYDRERIRKVLKKLMPLQHFADPSQQKFCPDFYVSDLHNVADCDACARL